MSITLERRRSSTVSHFTQLLVWQKAHQLFLVLAQDLEQLPHRRIVGIIADQLLRSVGSMSANIAEGFNAPTTKEYLYYLNKAKRSGQESENWLLKLRDLKILNGPVTHRLDACTEIGRMIDGHPVRPAV